VRKAGKEYGCPKRKIRQAETLHASNDGIANATSALSMFDQYDIDDLKHSSSDGQRIETQIPTIKHRNACRSSSFIERLRPAQAPQIESPPDPINDLNE
jgi:Tn3 transposase DDE domain